VERKFFLALITGEESTISKHDSVTAKMQRCILVLLHNGFCSGEKLLLFDVIALGIKEPSSLGIVIALVTF
jgi:hypothetical protein